MLGIQLPKQEFYLEGIDTSLLVAVCALMSIGVVAVATSSLDFAGATYGDPWAFVKKQMLFMSMGVVGGLFVVTVPTKIWNKYAGILLLLAVALLVLVLVPGIGKSVNGSRRWLDLGPMNLQASEAVKFCLVVYFASYLSRKNNEIKGQWFAFVKMIFVLCLIVFLLLLEPDFGSSVVISVTIAGMMFVAGIPIIRFLLLGITGVSGLVLMVFISPYRWERMVAFMDPWAKQFDSGYQLVQSLIAFGRGEWLGLGLGNSLQKLFFLPEAHTDFVFAILAEEFGLLGILLLVVLYGFFIGRILKLSKDTGFKGNLFSSYLVFGIGLMLAIQCFVNMGVASGMLPTKGLTLPLISYGGSSLLITCALIALVFRVHWEMRNER